MEIAIIPLLIAGVIIGALGKFVAPGNRDNIPIWLTVICGIAGVLIGYFVTGGTDTSGGFDWVRWIVSILAAAALVMVAATVTGRRSRTRT